MYISKQKLDEIKKEYSTLIMTDSDVVDAFNLVHDILIAEAEAIRAKASYATASISRLEQSAYEPSLLAERLIMASLKNTIKNG